MQVLGRFCSRLHCSASAMMNAIEYTTMTAISADVALRCRTVTADSVSWYRQSIDVRKKTSEIVYKAAEATADPAYAI